MEKKFTDGAFALVFKDDKFLLTSTHFKAGDFWSIPGGVVDPGETPADGAIREIFEETGIHCEVTEQLHVIDVKVTRDLRLTFFSAKYVGGEINIDPKEVEAADWFDQCQLNELEFEYDNTREIIERALARRA